jgi:hypothetical protein
MRQGDAPRSAAVDAIKAALADAGRPGEVPDLVWLNASPGHEEEVIRGIQDVVGSNILLVGGSAADNALASRWRLVTRRAVEQDAVLITVMFSSCRVSHSFEGGYSPTAHRGIVTAASDRIIHAIDGRPAAKVYDEWTDQLLVDVPASGGRIRAQTTLAPFGREVGRVGTVSCYSLSYPDAVLEDGSLSLFTQVAVGQELVLMRGSADRLASRVGRAVDCAIDLTKVKPGQIHGALLVCCAGGMLSLGERMTLVVEDLRRSLGDRALVGIFTYGEQGCPLGGEAMHGNLMVSSIVFSD